MSPRRTLLLTCLPLAAIALRPSDALAAEPAPDPPPAEEGVGATPSDRVDVVLSPIDDGQRYYARRRQPQEPGAPRPLLRSLCDPPCTESMHPGTHFIGVGPTDRTRKVQVEPVDVTGPGTLRYDYESHQGVRTAGAVLLPTSLTLGLVVEAALFLKALHDYNPNDVAPNCSSCAPVGGGTSPAVTTGLSVTPLVTLSLAVVGIIALALPDRAGLSFIPGAPASIPGLGGAHENRLAGNALDLRGGTIQLRF